MRRFGWLIDWRNYVTLALIGLVVLVGFVVIDASQGRDRAISAAKAALATRDQSASAASRRIDLLTGQIAELESELRDAHASAAGERGMLVEKVDALAEQVHQLGGRPVASSRPPAGSPQADSTAPTATTTTTVPTAAPAPTQPPSTQPPPSPTTTTTTVCLAAALGHCLTP